ncbi:putative V-type proton ATPase subunit [Halotydeus destructor]|nr:putative V-type proton ATPase subunit [Halotydeus destructor]
MGSLFRSEEMTLCQLFIQAEAAYNCISELGELGLLQFRDLNNEVNAFQRKFVSEIRRCDEMERNTNVLEAELIRDNIVVPRNIASFHCPGLREETQLESHLLKLVTELNEINQSALDMKKNELELIEVKHILVKSELFYNEAATPSTSSSQEIRRLSMANVKVENRSFLRESSANDELRDIPFHDLEQVSLI